MTQQQCPQSIMSQMLIIYSTEFMTRLRNFYRIHLTGSFFVVKAKPNLKCKFCKWKRRMTKNILSDAEVELIGYTSEKEYSESFRIIRLYDEENERKFTFLTNAKHISAMLPIFITKKARWTVL